MRLAGHKGKLTALGLVIALASCSSTAIDGCRIFKPIHGSKADTAGAQAQIDEHNARGVGACNWKARA
jgi:hypothetical protein